MKGVTLTGTKRDKEVEKFLFGKKTGLQCIKVQRQKRDDESFF